MVILAVFLSIVLLLWQEFFGAPEHQLSTSENWVVTANSDIKNYRPITILNAVLELFESLITHYLSSAFKIYFTEELFGFEKRKSIEFNWICYMHFLLNCLISSWFYLQWFQWLSYYEIILSSGPNNFSFEWLLSPWTICGLLKSITCDISKIRTIGTICCSRKKKLG